MTNIHERYIAHLALKGLSARYSFKLDMKIYTYIQYASYALWFMVLLGTRIEVLDISMTHHAIMQAMQIILYLKQTCLPIPSLITKFCPVPDLINIVQKIKVKNVR